MHRPYPSASLDFHSQDPPSPSLKPLPLKNLQHSQLQNKPELLNTVSSIRDRQLSTLLREEVKTLFTFYMSDYEQEIKNLKDVVEIERRTREVMSNDISSLKTNQLDNIQNPSPKTSAPNTLIRQQSQTKTSDLKILHLQNQLSLISSKQQEIIKINQIEGKNIQKLKQTFEHRIMVVNNELRLEIAEVRDSMTDVEESYRCKSQKLAMENNSLLNAIQENMDDLVGKSRNQTEQTIKIFNQLQRYNQSIQLNCNRTDIIQKHLKQLETESTHKYQSLKDLTQNKISQAQQLFQLSLQRIILPYNSNFEEIDRSVAELKQIVKDVLRFTKILGDKLVVKLNNTIDAATFQKIIENISESFNQTYLINTQKIKQLNEKEFEVYHQLNQVKNVLEDLKVQYQSSKKLNGDKQQIFEKRITSLGDLDLGLDSDGEEKGRGVKRSLRMEFGEFEQEETQEPNMRDRGFQNNPFRRKMEKELEEES